MIRRDPPPAGRAVLERVVLPQELPVRRLDRAVLESFAAFPTRASARKACERGEIAVGGLLSEPSRWVGPGDEIARLEPAAPAARTFATKLAVVHADDWLAVVVKPSGITTSGYYARTLEKALPHNLDRSPLPDALDAARPVHRLDAPTGGLVLVARTRAAHAALGQAFERREVHKRYRAIAIGRLEGEGAADGPVDDRAARTRWAAALHTRALRTDWITTLDLFPDSGRTHQIRRHLAGLGHPVLGDRDYGLPGRTLYGKGLFLYACALAFRHPATGEAVAFEVPEPRKFASFRAREQRRFERWMASDP